ncbi:glutamate-rich protein 3 [Hemiscyllium ocellatum]|uniref:glutamate-rich protein 3 n=1 Tax=Hemiscyllium ocellatum TaxID=170820 RepID=UPI0029665486|nr:glutamate-rich protein 3 [Hemiscyllium ocellatum]
MERSGYAGPQFPKTGNTVAKVIKMAYGTLAFVSRCMEPLATYNSLTDKHLTGYFNNTRVRRHLQRAGLVTKNGRIVSEKEYRLNVVRKDHQKYVRESLAQAIFHKVLEMERHHQLEIRKRLEDFARRERVQRIKVERARRFDEDIVPFLSPHPPIFPRNCHWNVSRPDVEHSDSSASPSSPRPSTAPGKLQRPVRLLPLQTNGAAAAPAITTQSSPYLRHREQHLDVTEGINSKHLRALDRDSIRNSHTLDFPSGMSPYRLPVINNYVTPVPPAARKREKNGCLRGRRLRPTTAPNGPAHLPAKEIPKSHRAVSHSNVLVTMVYRGKHLHLSYDQAEARDEVKVHQQHCGGENLCVYKGKLLEAEKFQFVSRRHSGFPFSLTFFLNGIQVNRLSSCCEYKHRKGSRLGGKQAYFAFVDVDGASPCYRCIIAMGLDKKPTPPSKRVKEEVVKEVEKEKWELTGDRDKLTVVNASGETSQEEAMTAESSVEEERMHEGQNSPARTEDGSSKEEYDDDFEEEEEKTNDELGERKSPADPEKERWSSDAEHQSENSDVRDEGSVSKKEHSDSSDSESEEELSRSGGSSRSSSYSPRSSEISDGERLEEEKTDDEEQERFTLSEDEGEHMTAKKLGAAPGESQQESCEVKIVNNIGREDEKVTGAVALLESQVDSEEKIMQSSGGEDQSPLKAATGSEEKVGMDEGIEANRETSANAESSNKEGAETDEEPLVTVGVQDRHSKDVALRGSEVSVCTAELSVSGRSVGE